MKRISSASARVARGRAVLAVLGVRRVRAVLVLGVLVRWVRVLEVLDVLVRWVRVLEVLDVLERAGLEVRFGSVGSLASF
jgi:hypothetical protein